MLVSFREKIHPCIFIPTIIVYFCYTMLQIALQRFITHTHTHLHIYTDTFTFVKLLKKKEK